MEPRNTCHEHGWCGAVPRGGQGAPGVAPPPEPWGQGMIVRIARGGLRDFWDNNERMVSGQMGFIEQSLWVATMTVVFAVMMAALWIVAR